MSVFHSPLYAPAKPNVKYARIVCELMLCDICPETTGLSHGQLNVDYDQARKILKLKNKRFGNLATEFMYLYHTVRDRDWTLFIYRLATVQPVAKEFGYKLQWMPNGGIPLERDVFLTFHTYKDLVDYGLLAKRLLEDVKRGNAPEDAMLMDSEDFGNFATEYVYLNIRKNSMEEFRQRMIITNENANSWRRSMEKKFSDISPVVDWFAVAAALIYGKNQGKKYCEERDKILEESRE